MAIARTTTGYRERLHNLHLAERSVFKALLRLVAYLVAAYLVIKLIPSLQAALEDLERLSVPWLLVVLGLEVLSETGFVVSWHSIVDPDNTIGLRAGGRRGDQRLAWAQLGAGIVVPAGSVSSVGAGTWLLHRFGMPIKLITERLFNLSFLNTAVDAFALIVFGILLATGVLAGESNLLLTLLPAAVAAAGVAGAIAVAARARRRAVTRTPRHAKVAAAVETLAEAVEDTAHLFTSRSGLRSVFGAVLYLIFDVLVLYVTFTAIHAHPTPAFGVVVMAYIIGGLGGSIPLPAGIGTVGGVVGMLIVYGTNHSMAVAAVVLYQAVGLLVPVVGGGIAYLMLRRGLHTTTDPEQLTQAPAGGAPQSPSSGS
jgi:MFS family permease